MAALRVDSRIHAARPSAFALASRILSIMTEMLRRRVELQCFVTQMRPSVLGIMVRTIAERSSWGV